jgi:hypothetical protein
VINLAQARTIVDLLTTAEHPHVAPNGYHLTAEDLALYDEPRVSELDRVDEADGYGPAMLKLVLCADLQDDVDLYLDDAGAVHVWSTLRIPPEDCDCECMVGGVADPGPHCPRHGDGVREIDCYRKATVAWELKEYASPGRSRWVLRAIPQDPIRDVLGEYRAARAKAKTC